MSNHTAQKTMDAWMEAPVHALVYLNLYLERVKTTSTVYECTKYLVYEKVIIE